MDRRKHDSEKRRKARSNIRDELRLQHLRMIYMLISGDVERRFLASIRELPQEERMRSLRGFRDGAVEILGAIEDVFGPEGVRAISHHIRHAGISRRLKELDEDECDEDECEYRTRIEDFDDTPRTYERIEARHAKPWEHLSKERRFPFEIIDEDESRLDDDDEDDEDDEEYDFDILSEPMDWDTYRDLWKDFDSMYG